MGSDGTRHGPRSDVSSLPPQLPTGVHALESLQQKSSFQKHPAKDAVFSFQQTPAKDAVSVPQTPANDAVLCHENQHNVGTATAHGAPATVCENSATPALHMSTFSGTAREHMRARETDAREPFAAQPSHSWGAVVAGIAEPLSAGGYMLSREGAIGRPSEGSALLTVPHGESGPSPSLSSTQSLAPSSVLMLPAPTQSLMAVSSASVPVSSTDLPSAAALRQYWTVSQIKELLVSRGIAFDPKTTRKDPLILLLHPPPPTLPSRRPKVTLPFRNKQGYDISVERNFALTLASRAPPPPHQQPLRIEFHPETTALEAQQSSSAAGSESENELEQTISEDDGERSHHKGLRARARAQAGRRSEPSAEEKKNTEPDESPASPAPILTAPSLPFSLRSPFFSSPPVTSSGPANNAKCSPSGGWPIRCYKPNCSCSGLITLHKDLAPHIEQSHSPADLATVIFDRFTVCDLYFAFGLYRCSFGSTCSSSPTWHSSLHYFKKHAQQDHNTTNVQAHGVKVKQLPLYSTYLASIQPVKSDPPPSQAPRSTPGRVLDFKTRLAAAAAAGSHSPLHIFTGVHENVSAQGTGHASTICFECPSADYAVGFVPDYVCEETAVPDPVAVAWILSQVSALRCLQALYESPVMAALPATMPLHFVLHSPKQIGMPLGYDAERWTKLMRMRTEAVASLSKYAIVTDQEIEDSAGARDAYNRAAAAAQAFVAPAPAANADPVAPPTTAMQALQRGLIRLDSIPAAALPGVVTFMRPLMTRLHTYINNTSWRLAVVALIEAHVQLAALLVVADAGGHCNANNRRRVNDIKRNIRRLSAATWGRDAEFEASIAAEDASAAAAAAEKSEFRDVPNCHDDYQSGSDDDDVQLDPAAFSTAHKTASAQSHAAFSFVYSPPRTDEYLADPTRPPPSEEEVARQGKEVEALVRRINAMVNNSNNPAHIKQGIIKACQMLLNPPPITIKNAQDPNLDKIRQQHPQGDLTTIPPLPSSAPPILVSEEEALKAMEACSGPYAAGVSGVTGTVWSQLAKSDTHICSALTAVLSMIVNASCPEPALHAFLTAGKATLIGKKDTAIAPTSIDDTFHADHDCVALQDLLASNTDYQQHGKFRTINVGEPLLKAAGKLVLNKLPRDQVQTAVGPTQVGVGTPSGVERYILSMQAAVEKYANDPAFITLSLDISDAFMKANRAKIMQALFELPGLAPVWRLARWHLAAANPRFLRMTDGEIFSFLQSDGGPQGDPLMPLMFSVLIAVLHKQVLSGKNVDAAAAYLDDTTLAGLTHVLRPIYEEMERLAPGMCGFSLNPIKSVACSYNSRPSETVAEFVRDHKLVFDHGFTAMVGGVVGLDEQRMQTWLLNQVREHALLFRVLSHRNMRSWLVLRMLRHVMLPRMNHLLRAHSPHVTSPAAQLFDKCVSEVFSSRFALPELSPANVADRDSCAQRAAQQACLPVNHMGMGIVPAEATAFAASLAGLASASPAILRVVEQAAVARPATASTAASPPPRSSSPLLQLQNRLTACHALMTTFAPATLVEKKLPSDLTQFLQFFSQESRDASPSHLQRTFFQACAATAAERLKASAPTAADQCRYSSLSVTGAQSFLNANADDLHVRIADSLFQAYARLQLGLPCHPDLARFPRARCACGFLLSQDPANHFLSCKKACGSKIIARHDRLNREMQAIANELGISCSNERILHNHKRLDADYTLPHLAEVIGTDWSVVHPASSSFQASQARTVPGYAAQHRANRKTAKYDAQVRKQGGIFLPLVVETFGGFHQSVLKLLIEMRKAAEMNGAPSIPPLAALRNRLAAVLIQGNAEIVQAGVDKMSRD